MDRIQVVSFLNATQLSFSGLYLDPTRSTVGGTRDIFSNAVMTGLIYLGWTYRLTTGETTTIDDVNNYLKGKTPEGQDVLVWRLMDASGMDMGTLQENGWTLSF